MNIQVQTDRTLIRVAGRSTRYVLLSFAALESQRTSQRDPVNVSFVIDRSGSMGGSKIDLARDAVVQALRMLKPSDRFSVISYDDQVEVVVPSTLATSEAVRNAVSQVQQLAARGNTDLGGGWFKGCEQIAAHVNPGQVTRCLLVSDGLANHGITDRDELARHAGALRERGIATSTIGVGDDYDERLLERMSRAGGGHFYNVEMPVQIADILASELGEALEVVARNVEVLARREDGVRVETLNRFAVQERGDGTTSVRLGDLVSHQEVSLVVKLKFPAAEVGKTARVMFSITDTGGVFDATETDLIWTFAEHHANDIQPRNVVVDRAVAALYAAQAKAEALELNRAGRYEDAKARLEATARRVKKYAGNDPALLAIVEELEQRDAVYAAPMSPWRMKAEHFASFSAAQMRTSNGKARRRPSK